MSSDSDSDAPEAVSFSASKSDALEKLHQASQAAKAEKSKAKQIRKEREQLYKAQKQEKLARLASLIPTEEELQQLPEDLSEDFAAKKSKIEEKPNKIVFKDFDDNDECPNEDDENFISFSATKFKVVHVKKDIDSRLNSRVPDSVRNFKETMLYGKGSKCRREASEDVVRRKQKMKTIKKLK